MKKIIINADDFGLSSSINKGILKAHKEGLVSSISLMPCSQAFQEAVQIIQENNIKDVGIHLVLDEEKAILPSSEIPDLVDRNGYFHPRSKLLKKLFLLTATTKQQIRNELRAQIETVLNNGIIPTHIDGHGHVHLYPNIVEIVIALMKDYDIKKTRLSYEPFTFFPRTLSLTKIINKTVVNLFSIYGKQQFIQNGIAFPNKFYGISYGGNLNTKRLSQLIALAPESQITEIMTHPGYFSQSELSKYRTWNYSWESELLATLEIKRDALSDVELVSFCQL